MSEDEPRMTEVEKLLVVLSGKLDQQRQQENRAGNSNITILSYGGGRQTVAYCVLIAQGRVSKPDRIVIADTGREKPGTWDYLEEITRPLLASVGLEVEIAPRNLSYVDLYSHQGTLLLPVYTPTGKFKAYCSNEWKASVIQRHLKLTALGWSPEQIRGMSQAAVREQMLREADYGYTSLIGFALDERDRVKGHDGRRYPLIEMMFTKLDCQNIILQAGLPLPFSSACWMCANQDNEEWRALRDNYPPYFEMACQLDEDLREEDIAAGNGGVWLHHSRVPLREANLDTDEGVRVARQCGLGLCMV